MNLLAGEVFEQNEQLAIVMEGKLHSITENTFDCLGSVILKSIPKVCRI